MLDSYARKITLERRTSMFEKSMIEYGKRKHFEAMVTCIPKNSILIITHSVRVLNLYD